MNYESMSDPEKRSFLLKYYENSKKSFKDIADMCGTYSNKLRRDAIKFNIKIRDKSEAQRNALKTGKAPHPTKGKQRSEDTKNKIGMSVLNSWENMDDKTLEKRKKKAKQNWENLSQDDKDNILKKANDAVRETSRVGSKLEKYLLQRLLEDGYHVDFHKEQSLVNTKLQIDLFIPKMRVAIEVDGPSHFEPVWGNDALDRNKKYDDKKTGLILGKGLVLIRIKYSKDFSKSRGELIYRDLSDTLENIKLQFPSSDNRIINLGE